MENSTIYGLLFRNFIYDYREQLEKDESDGTAQKVLKAQADLEKALNAEQLKLVDNYKHKLIMREEDIDIQTEIKILNYGIMIGMQIQRAFDEFELE